MRSALRGKSGGEEPASSSRRRPRSRNNRLGASGSGYRLSPVCGVCCGDRPRHAGSLPRRFSVRSFVGWAKRSVPTIYSFPRGQRKLCPPYDPSLETGPPQDEGDDAPSANPSCPRSCEIVAGASRRANRGISGTGPRFPVCRRSLDCAPVVSQLLAGTPSGPGGSPDAARVPCCNRARGRRTSSRFTTPHDRAPQWTR